MSVTVTKATIDNTVPYFLVKVLRNELTDSHSPARNDYDWIIKSPPKDNVEPNDLPRVVLDASPIPYANWNIDGSKYDVGEIGIECWIMTGGDNVTNGSIEDRDTYTDAIRVALFNQASSETDGTTLADNKLIMRSFMSTVSDFIPADHPKIIRAKRLIMIFKYYGG